MPQKFESEADFQEVCDRIIQREIIACFSSLISTIASESYANGDLGEEALNLLEPEFDYESPAIENDWKQSNGQWTKQIEGELVTCDDAQEACEYENLEPYQREIFEHWAVSQWLANKLAEKGEKIGEFNRFRVWARTTTGQAISMDSCIRAIVKNLL